VRKNLPANFQKLTSAEEQYDAFHPITMHARMPGGENAKIVLVSGGVYS